MNLTRTQALLSRELDALLRCHGLTQVTYNILRILRGAGKRGLPCAKIGERMLTRVPDVTRLVDRLVKLGLVERYRTEEDRRLVFQRLTPTGRRLLADLDGPVRELHDHALGHLSDEELDELNALLVKARAHVSG